MNVPADRAKSSSAGDTVTNELRRSIVSGDLAPGQTFSLGEISARLNVSLMPVREALRTLVGEGLVITRPGRSPLVAPLHLDDLRAIYQLRRDLEPEIAGRSCLLITDEHLSWLEAQAADFGDARHTIQTVYDSHHDFHAALLAPAATPWDMRILNALWRAAERYIRIGFGGAGPHPSENARRERAHQELIQVFRLRDRGAVEAAVRTHLAGNEQAALRALDGGRAATV